MNYPNELQYSRDHEWLRMEDGVALSSGQCQRQQ